MLALVATVIMAMEIQPKKRKTTIMTTRMGTGGIIKKAI
jgi:hypothetical protein